MGRMQIRNKYDRRKKIKKTGAAKRQRIKVQRRRLVALGMSEDKVAKMDPYEVRQLLKRPAKLKK